MLKLEMNVSEVDCNVRDQNQAYKTSVFENVKSPGAKLRLVC